MKRLLLIGAAAATLLAGCGTLRDMGFGGKEDPANPKVFINAFGEQKVWPDPLEFQVDQKNVTITWRLDDASLTFAPDGIVIEDRQEEIVGCEIGKDARTFTCLNRHTKPGEYKYTVRLLQAGKPLSPYDPHVRNK